MPQGKINLVIKNKLVGIIDLRRKIYVTRREDKHLFQIFNGFGISYNVFDALEKYNVKKIEILYHSFIFSATRSDFYVSGTHYNHEGDEQLILPLRKFNKRSRTKREVQLTI